MQEEYFWSVCLEANSVQAAIWTIKDSVGSVVSISNPVNWENEETLIAGADECLSSCIQNLPENVTEPTKTVFGVISSWVKEGQIEKVHLDKIRVLCNKLSLTPTGFVVLPEALSHFIKSSEKTPLSAVLIGVYQESLEVSVFRLGNLAGSVSVGRSTNITEDVTEALARFDSLDPLPSRFLIYDSKAHDLEEFKQSLIKSDWDLQNEKVKFLHTPQVEIIKEEEKMTAISLAGAVEINDSKGITFNSPAKEKKEEEVYKEDPKDANIEGIVDPASLGFSVGTDVHEPIAPKIKRELPKIKLNLRLDFLNKNFTFIVTILVFFILVGGFVAFWFLPKDEVTIFVSPKKITGKQVLKFDPNATTIDFSKLVIPAKNVSTSVTSDKTKVATGTKVVGTPSKGSVTFYNVGGGVTIPGGTILTASNLQFSLDSDTQVASASGAASAATAKGNITAASVGADSNLASGTYFSVGNFSSSLLQAKNDSDLSGGSSREVTAVSSSDLTSLTNDLTSDVTTKAKDNIKTNLTGDNLLIENTVLATTSAKTFDHAAGDEAETVKLTMTSNVTALTVSRQDLDDLAQKLFAGEVTKGFVMKDDQIDFRFEPNDVNFMINLLPSLNTSDIAREISGKSVADARNILSKIPGFQDMEIKETVRFPLINLLPHVPANISITVSGK